MGTTTKLNCGQTRRMPNAGAFTGIYTGSVESDETTARVITEVFLAGNGTSRTSLALDVEGLRALAADLLTAAAFIEDQAAQRAVNDPTNTSAA